MSIKSFYESEVTLIKLFLLRSQDDPHPKWRPTETFCLRSYDGLTWPMCSMNTQRGNPIRCVLKIIKWTFDWYMWHCVWAFNLCCYESVTLKMSKMTNCQNDPGGRELNGEPTHTIIWEPYGILQSFIPHSLHSFNDFILLFIHSFPIRLLSHSFSYSSTLTVIPFNLTISLWQENETLSWIAKTSKNGHFCVTTHT